MLEHGIRYELVILDGAGSVDIKLVEDFLSDSEADRVAIKDLVSFVEFGEF